MTIHVEIVTPERLLISDDVDMVSIPGAEGQMGILGGHAPLLTTMEIGEIMLHRGADTQFLAVAGGVVEVRPNKVTILADVAETAEEIDENRAEAARERARESLSDNPPPQRRVVIEAALRRSNLRLKVARRRRARSSPGFEAHE